MARTKVKRHVAPKHVTVPPRVRARAQQFAAEIQRLNAQTQTVMSQLQEYLNGWAAGVGVNTEKGDWHFPADYSELRQGKPPEPTVVTMDEINAIVEGRKKKAATAKGR